MGPRLRPGPGGIALGGGDWDEFLLQDGPTSGVLQGEVDEGGKAHDDHKELEHLVVNGGGETPEEDINEDDEGGDGDTGPVVPVDESL